MIRRGDHASRALSQAGGRSRSRFCPRRRCKCPPTRKALRMSVSLVRIPGLSIFLTKMTRLLLSLLLRASRMCLTRRVSIRFSRRRWSRVRRRCRVLICRVVGLLEGMISSSRTFHRRKMRVGRVSSSRWRSLRVRKMGVFTRISGLLR